MTGKYGEPWDEVRGSKYRTELLSRAETVLGTMSPRHGKRARLCVNACTGLSDEALQADVVGVVREALREAQVNLECTFRDAGKRRNAAIEQISTALQLLDRET